MPVTNLHQWIEELRAHHAGTGILDHNHLFDGLDAIVVKVFGEKPAPPETPPTEPPATPEPPVASGTPEPPIAPTEPAVPEQTVAPTPPAAAPKEPAK